MIPEILQDLKFGVTQLLKNPGFTAVAVLTVALGTGANTAIFSLFNAVLLRPLPFREPERLVWISNPASGEGLPGLTRRSNFIDWKQMTKSIASFGAYLGFAPRINYTLTDEGEPTRVEGAIVTEGFLETLGVPLALGRNFVREEYQHNGPRVILLTDRFWKIRFHGESNIVGKSVRINNAPWIIAGVLPESFDFSDVFAPGSRPVDFFRPYQDAPGYENWGNMLAVIARMKPGVTMSSVQAEFDLINLRLTTAHPERGNFGARVTSLRDKVSGPVQRPFVALAGAAICVLLIACANLSNLLLAQGASRRKELAIRVALGASRLRLLRQLFTENLLLAGSGSLLGLFAAFFVAKSVALSGAFSIPLLQRSRLDLTSLGFAALLALATGLAFGLIPALVMSQANPHGDLKSCSSGIISAARASRSRRGFVIAEVALALVLLVGAGLLLRSLSQLLQVDPGFRPAEVASWRIAPNREFSTHQQEISFYRELLERIQALPGVDSATLATTLPFELNDLVRVHLKGEANVPAQTPDAFLREVGGMNYFKAMGIPVRAGRDFGPADASALPKPVVVNETMARQLCPGRSALDQILVLESPPDPAVECKIVGVVGDVRQSALEQAAGPEMYLFNWGGRQLVVRASQPVAVIVPAVRAALQAFNPLMVANEYTLLQESVDRMVSPKRLVVLLVGAFSLLSLLLASVGIYGVIAHSVSQRTREIGLRLALGSQPALVQRLIIKEAMTTVLVGCAIGCVLALILGRTMQALLFGVSTADPLTFISSLILLLCVGFAACSLPAWRAAGIDPIAALRGAD
jgi:predicted permease